MPKNYMNTYNYLIPKYSTFASWKIIHPTGIKFLLGVLLTIIISFWVILSWTKYGQYLLPPKLVSIQNYYVYNSDINQSIQTLKLYTQLKKQCIFQNHHDDLLCNKQIYKIRYWLNQFKIYLIKYTPTIIYWNQHIVKKNKDLNITNNFNKLEDLSNLYSIDNNEKILQDLHKIIQILAKNSLTLENVTMTNSRACKLTLNNGIKLNLGSQDIVNRILRFIEIYPVLQQQAQMNGQWIRYIDLRYDSGAAVSWKSTQIKELN